MNMKVLTGAAVAVILVSAGIVAMLVVNSSDDVKKLPETYTFAVVSEPDGLAVSYCGADATSCEAARGSDSTFTFHGSDYGVLKDGNDWLFKNNTDGSRYKLLVDCGGISFTSISHSGCLDITFGADTVKCDRITVSFVAVSS